MKFPCIMIYTVKNEYILATGINLAGNIIFGYYLSDAFNHAKDAISLKLYSGADDSPALRYFAIHLMKQITDVNE